MLLVFVVLLVMMSVLLVVVSVMLVVSVSVVLVVLKFFINLGNGDLLVKSGFGAGPADEADGVVDGLLLIAFTFIAVGDTVEHTGVERHEAGVSVDADGNGALLENFDDLGESGTGKGLCGVASLKHSALDSTVLASTAILSLVSHVAVFAGDSVGVAVADGRSGPSTIASVSGH